MLGPHGDGASLKRVLRRVGDGWETVVLPCLHDACHGSKEGVSGWRRCGAGGHPGGEEMNEATSLGPQES